MSARVHRFCSYHCRSCNGHFTSLKAFDAHRPRNKGQCEWPDDLDLVERTGACRISNPEQTLKRVTVYEHPSAVRARETFARRQ